MAGVSDIASFPIQLPNISWELRAGIQYVSNCIEETTADTHILALKILHPSLNVCKVHSRLGNGYRLMIEEYEIKALTSLAAAKLIASSYLMEDKVGAKEERKEGCLSTVSSSRLPSFNPASDRIPITDASMLEKSEKMKAALDESHIPDGYQEGLCRQLMFEYPDKILKKGNLGYSSKPVRIDTHKNHSQDYVIEISEDRYYSDFNSGPTFFLLSEEEIKTFFKEMEDKRLTKSIKQSLLI